MQPNVDNHTCPDEMLGIWEKRLVLWGGPDLQSILLETLDNTKKLVNFFKGIEFI
jgi:hypothetical protein